MAIFEYEAKDERGSVFSGVYRDIDNVSALRQELSQLGYNLIRARRRRAPRSASRRIKQTEIVTFAYRFAGMCSAGLSIARCFEVLEEQTENQQLKAIIADIRQRVETGSSLKDAFVRHKDIFSEFFLGMIEAGESGGKLSNTLETAAVYLEKQADLKRQVKAAFMYPVLVGTMCIFIIAYLVTFVIPVFTKVYQQLHVSLSGPTLMLVAISAFIRARWPFILIASAGIFVLLRKLSGKPQWQARWHAFKLEMPVFGKLNRMLTVSRFMRTFAMLASAGVSYLEAFEIAGVVANNLTIKRICARLQEKVGAGNTVTEAISEYEIFPPILVQLAAAGEEAGVLPDMLNKGVDFLDKDIGRTVNALLVKLEPMLTLIMGAVVGFILMAVYLPMFDYMSHLK
jgi:type IV pilus assembly protein PilC